MGENKVMWLFLFSSVLGAHWSKHVERNKYTFPYVTTVLTLTAATVNETLKQICPFLTFIFKNE